MRLSLPRLRSSQSSLTALYDHAAHGWQAGVTNLGFDAAYADLCRDVAVEGRVLDAGCGTGALSMAFAAAAGAPVDLDLLDPSPAMLTEAQRALPDAGARIGTVWTGLLGDDAVPDAAYAHILCAHVIEHVDDPMAALHWLWARLRPGGQAVLAVSKPHWCTALVRWRWGNRTYLPETLTQMLAKAGFTAIEIRPFAKGPPSRVSCGYIARRP